MHIKSYKNRKKYLKDRLNNNNNINANNHKNSKRR